MVRIGLGIQMMEQWMGRKGDVHVKPFSWHRSPHVIHFMRDASALTWNISAAHGLYPLEVLTIALITQCSKNYLGFQIF